MRVQSSSGLRPLAALLSSAQTREGGPEWWVGEAHAPGGSSAPAPQLKGGCELGRRAVNPV